MKILLRNYGEERYVWKTAKYGEGGFTVDGNAQPIQNVVSILNDNRKNYFKCSCCGKVFRKGSDKFEEHKRNAIKPKTCLDCNRLCVGNEYITESKYIINPDGTFTKKTESKVSLQCSASGLWSYDYIDSAAAIRRCNKRQCAGATEKEIKDIFIEYPGVFDDIITVDALLDDGLDIKLPAGVETDFQINSSEDIYAIVNKIGIIKSFVVYIDGDYYDVYYSKKYDKLFGEDYKVWHPTFIDEEQYETIKADIAILYN
jgi:hypothetical protein